MLGAMSILFKYEMRDRKGVRCGGSTTPRSERELIHQVETLAPRPFDVVVTKSGNPPCTGRVYSLSPPRK